MSCGYGDGSPLLKGAIACRNTILNLVSVSSLSVSSDAFQNHHLCDYQPADLNSKLCIVFTVEKEISGKYSAVESMCKPVSSFHWVESYLIMVF